MSLTWYKWYLSAWLPGETRAGLTLAERGLYRDCLDLHYQEGSIPANLTVLRRVLGVDEAEFQATWPSVSKHFITAENDATRLVNRRAIEELQKLHQKSSTNASNGRLGGLAKTGRALHSTTSGSKANAKRTLKRTPEIRSSEILANKNKKENKNTPLPPKGELWVDRFAEWWDLWPKKTAKPDAKKAYRKLVVDGKAKPEQGEDLAPYPDFESRHAQLIEATKAWAPEFARRDIDKVPYPATYLNRLDWLSAPATANSASGSPSHAEAIARLKRTKRSIDGPHQMAWESTPQWHDRIRKLGWPIPS